MTDIEQETSKKGNQSLFPLVFAFMTFLLVVAGFNYYVHTVLFKEVEQRELRSLEAMLSSYSQQVEEQMIGVDTALSALAIIGTSDKYTDREKYLLLKQTEESLDIVRVLGFTDHTGKIIGSSRAFPAPDLTLAGRDYIDYFLKGGLNQRYLSGPVRNLVDNKWQIAMSRPVRDAYGILLGVTTSVIDPVLMIDRIAKASLPDDYVTLLDHDMLLIARKPAKDERTGTSLADAEILQALASSKTGYVASTYRNLFTGDKRLGAAKRVFGGDLIIVSSRPYAAAMEYWNVFSIWTSVASVLLLMFVAALLWFINLRFTAAKERNQLLRDLNQKVTEQKAKAEKLARIKDDFLANMSHEIRTPMNAITGLSQLLQRTNLSNIQRDYVRQIGLSGKFLLGIIDEILTFSKMEADQLSVEQEPYELADIIDNVGSIMSVALSEKPIEVIIDVDPTLPKIILGDAQRIQQVLVNLASNAIKFTHAGTVTLQVGYGQLANHPKSIRFTVQDTGIGIPSDKLETIFDPFTQADETTVRRYGGTGLGLAITQRLVDRMKGTISVDSKPGQGSSFTVDLPLETVDGSNLERPSATFKKYHVLLVDDHQPTLKALMSMAQGLNMFVETALSGSEAIAKIKTRKEQNKKFDVLFIDWQMPELDGLETIRAIESIVDKDQMPAVVMVTAYQREYLEQRGADAGTTELRVLTKPVTASSMLNAILAAAHETSDLKTDPRRHRAQSDNASLEGISILVAEDNHLNQQVAKELLKSVGATVTIAENGLEALSCLKQQQFDIVLMDIQMPTMDGIEATRRIRADPNFANIPVLALTAGVLDSEREKCTDAGMNGFVGKPFEIDALVKKIMSTLDIAEPQPQQNAAETAQNKDFSDDPLWDAQKALELAGGDKQLMRTLVSLFPDMVSEKTEDIDKSLTDQQEFATLVHALQGAASQIAADRAHKMGRHLEQEAREGDWDTARNLWPVYKSVLQETVLELQTWLSHKSDS
ncbi:hybrid sensor histidine kinase/response regulator [Thalassospira alkalitolerans]|uniref:hybrid sensor histidine kinase/response regulator n=1 Tax=Thalassospira alkalitolerans TaxID=1293890 RepID=UPI00146F0544|nr:hybrid sensor histidine kinase/response regulator [Thalassospira alkalitolerans]